MKTPLKIETQESPFGDRCSTFDAAGFLICDNEAYYPHPVAPEHQERIVACVNACAGMDDPEAEIAALRAGVKELMEVVCPELGAAMAELTALANNPPPISADALAAAVEKVKWESAKLPKNTLAAALQVEKLLNLP